MILSTMNGLPGYEVTEVLGEVFGITVRSRNVGSQLGAMRFDASEFQAGQEICACGTAVRIRRLDA
jgi:uncharacterized protein YbjQ (UPF0145 family)